MNMIVRVLVAAALIALPGIVCEARAQEVKLPATLAWTAYDVGSSGYNQAVAIGAALKNKYGVSLRVLPGKNDISRLLPLREDKVQLSLNGIGSLFANEGVLEFGVRSWGPQKVRMLAVSAADSLTTLVTAKDANIVTPADLKGKRVFWVVGAPSLNQNLTACLAFAGLEWKDVQKVEFGGFAQAMQGIIQGQVDAGFAQTTTGHLYQLASSPRGIHYPTFPHKDTAAWNRLLKAAPYFVRGIGTEGANMSKDKPVEGLNYPYPALIAYDRVQADLVYNTTKAMFDAYPMYKDGAPGASGWDLKRQVFEWVLPFHDGAIRYYKEAGLWDARKQAHQDALLKREATLQAAWQAYLPKAPAEDKAFEEGWLKARAAALTAAGLEAYWK
ncbi:MAG: TAXI family TRAP transporter solute-binding subunit [Candidatus Rokubacteria bacterium]|nr:TAXI family TRAP transporter solute-binding subunit [Candidatus Rokubacteria bacterium]